MKTKQKEPKDIDEYIAGFPDHIQEILEKIRATIRKTVPEAEETISYRIPAFTLSGVLVYFAAFKNHIGFYPRTTGITRFRKELSRYNGAKGSVRFPLDKAIPFGLIGKIAKARAKENLERAKKKQR